eukprot:CAMPEP_0178922958 /NCGR_PEP_ID=MMETSP0786-20121207/16451_1 /TAXON_ID=186022 /ORGANISM="Thalassionema frauenfeldii, Strain CCMP 1798" /LENGTH=97 /DNA_ID=CAMNT_0020597397 /DNA_START=236 /DNA_END=530 /DNA_ORIENTATION=-
MGRFQFLLFGDKKAALLAIKSSSKLEDDESLIKCFSGFTAFASIFEKAALLAIKSSSETEDEYLLKFFSGFTVFVSILFDEEAGAGFVSRFGTNPNR